MANTKKYFTLNDINDVIELFEDFLKDNGITIPECEKQKVKYGDENNEALIYGMVYGDLQYRLITHFEKLADDGKVAPVVNSWDGEVETW